MRTISALFVAAVLTTATTANAQMKKPAQQPAVPAPGTAIAATTNAPGVVVSTNTENSDSARRIDRDEAIKMVKSKKAVWIDVRPSDIYAQGHIAGAMNIPLSDLERRFKDLPPGKFYITYCA